MYLNIFLLVILLLGLILVTDKIKNKVNIDVLNARLNKVKRLNIYSTVKIIILATGVLLLFTIIIVKF